MAGSDDEHQRLREGVAGEYKIALYRQYGEAEAAHFLQVDLSTLKRWRREGKVPYINMAERKVRYLGVHIVDLLIKGSAWADTPNANANTGNTGSGSGQAPQHTTAAGWKAEPSAALRLAQQTLKKPSSG